MADINEKQTEKKLDEKAKEIKQKDGQISEADLKKVSGGGVKDHTV